MRPIFGIATISISGGPAAIIIGVDGRGEIAFGAVQATLEIEYGSTSNAFAWVDSDEMDEVSGECAAELLDDGSINIEFEYDSGGNAFLKATRESSSTTATECADGRSNANKLRVIFLERGIVVRKGKRNLEQDLAALPEGEDGKSPSRRMRLPIEDIRAQ